MATYETGDYSLSIPFDFSKLVVTRLSDNNKTEYDLTTETSVTFDDDTYTVEVESLTGTLHEESFNPDEDLDPALVPEPFRFNNNTWIGSADLRDMGRVTEYHYDLENCEVSFHFISVTEITVKCRCKGSCSGPESCFDVVNVDL